MKPRDASRALTNFWSCLKILQTSPPDSARVFELYSLGANQNEQHVAFPVGQTSWRQELKSEQVFRFVLWMRRELLTLKAPQDRKLLCSPQEAKRRPKERTAKHCRAMEINMLTYSSPDYDRLRLFATAPKAQDKVSLCDLCSY